MKVSEAYKGFLAAEDLPENSEFKITIEAIRKANGKDKGLDGKAIDKPIVKIKGKDKEWVLNKTNARTIRRVHGNEMDEWEGKHITIFRTTCDSFGDTVPCIRVKAELNNNI